MVITITVTRSASWVSAQRVATGENVPVKIDVPVDITLCNPDTRAMLLQIGQGEYLDIKKNVCFDSGHKPNTGRFGAYGDIPICVDSDSPTTSEIESAIATALAVLAEKKAEADRIQAELNAKVEADRIEKERKAEAIANARLLLADELQKITLYKTQRDTLADFLATIPQDALRGAVRKIANSENSITTIQAEIEDASPVVIFTDSDSEE